MARELGGELDGLLPRLFTQPPEVGGAVPLTMLGNYRAGGPLRWEYGFPASYAVVDYVATVHGRERLGDLLRAAATADSLGAALLVALDQDDLSAVERDWRAFARRAYGGQ